MSTLVVLNSYIFCVIFLRGTNKRTVSQFVSLLVFKHVGLIIFVDIRTLPTFFMCACDLRVPFTCFKSGRLNKRE